MNGILSCPSVTNFKGLSPLLDPYYGTDHCKNSFTIANTPFDFLENQKMHGLEKAYYLIIGSTVDSSVRILYGLLKIIDNLGYIALHLIGGVWHLLNQTGRAKINFKAALAYISKSTYTINAIMLNTLKLVPVIGLLLSKVVREVEKSIFNISLIKNIFSQKRSFEKNIIKQLKDIEHPQKVAISSTHKPDDEVRINTEETRWVWGRGNQLP